MQPLLLIWILLIGFMFYFLMIKPQKKARAQQLDMLSHLKVGSEVRTTAQIMGTVVELTDEYAIVETTPGVLIKFGKPAIVGIVLSDEEVAEAEDAPVPGGIGDAPAGSDAVSDAVPAEAAADAEGAAEKAADAAEAPAESAEPAAKS